MSPTTSEEQERLRKLLKQFQTAMLITHAGDGQLRARPMAIAEVADDGRVWFITGTESAKAHEISRDTRVHIVCQNDHSSYVSISGRAALVHDRAKVVSLWREPFRVWFPEGKDDPNIALIEVQPESGEFWDSEGMNKIKYLFRAAKAYAIGVTPEIDEGIQHGRVQL
jgi:general stress protein 26